MSEAAAGHSHLLRGQYAVDGGNAPKVEIPPPADQMHMYHFRHISCCFIATSPALSEAYAVTRRPWCCFMSQSYSNIPNNNYMVVFNMLFLLVCRCFATSPRRPCGRHTRADGRHRSIRRPSQDHRRRRSQNAPLSRQRTPKERSTLAGAQKKRHQAAEMSKPPFEHRSNANHLSRSLYTYKTFRFSTAHHKPAPNSLTSKPITQPQLTPSHLHIVFPPIKLRSALVGTRFLSRETTLCVCKDSKYFVHHKIPTLYSVKKFTQVHGSFI